MPREKDLNKAYEAILKKRAENVAKNVAEGRSLDNLRDKGTQFIDTPMKKVNPNTSSITESIKGSGGLVENLSSKGSKVGVSHNALEEAVERAGKEALEMAEKKAESGGLSGLISKITKSKAMAALPILGTVAAMAPALYSGGAKASEGDYMGAAKEGAGLAANMLVPDALRTDDLNAGEEDMIQKAINAQPTEEREQDRRMNKMRNLLFNK